MAADLIQPIAEKEGISDASSTGSDAQNPLTPRDRVPALDGLRGLAILAVFLFHYVGEGGTPHSFLVRGIHGITRFGWAGVDLFFVLSGFLITGILFDTQHSPHYYRAFYIRRTLRIFPLYYFFLGLVAFVGVLLGVRWTAGHALFLVYLGYPGALILPNLVKLPYIRLVHLWSLSVEEQFYLLWPFLIRTLSTSRRILRLCLGLMCLALTMRLLMWGTGWLNGKWAYMFLPFRIDSLALGAALAVLARGPSFERVMKLAPYVLLLTTPILGVLLVFSPNTRPTEAPQMWTLGFTLNALISGSLLLLALRPMGIVVRVFNTSFLRKLGKYSYGIYIYHFPLAAILEAHKPAMIHALHSEFIAKLVFIPGALFINYLGAKASYEFFESPVLNLKSRFPYDGDSGNLGFQATGFASMRATSQLSQSSITISSTQQAIKHGPAAKIDSTQVLATSDPMDARHRVNYHQRPSS